MVKISIIMPVYNDETKLENSIGSVINQTLNELELICVDDGSTDNSLNILHSFAEEDNRIRIFSQKNQGAGKARNKGLKEANGEYIAFLDSDDYIVDNNALNILYSEASTRNMIMASGSMQFVSEKGINTTFKCFKEIEKLSLKSPKDYCVPWYFYKNIFKRDFLIKHNIKFPDLLRGQDPLFLCEVLTRIDEFLEVPVMYYSYNTPTANKLNNSVKYYDYFVHFYEVFKLICNKKFDKMVHEYSKSLINLKDRDVHVYNKNELINLLEVMDNIVKVFVSYGDKNLTKNIVSSFNEMINKIYINNLMIITDEDNNHIPDAYSNTITLIDNPLIPKVSVVIPVYNVEKYLRECLDSIVNQTLTDIEIICINDGSTDNSLEIVKEYALNDSRINIYLQENHGLAFTRTQGIKYATGKYIYFMDGDDILDETALEKTYEICEMNNLDMLIFKLINFDDDTRKQFTSNYYEMNFLKNMDGKIFNYTDIGENLLQMAVSAPGKLFRHDLIHNLEFPSGLIFEDNPFFIEAMFKSKRVSFWDKHLYYRRIRLGSITTTAENRNFSDTLKIANKIIDITKKYGEYDAYLKVILDKKLRSAYGRFQKVNIKYKQDFFNEMKSDFINRKIEFERVLMDLIPETRCIYELALNCDTYKEYQLSIDLFNSQLKLSEFESNMGDSHLYQTARLDLKNTGNETNSFEIIENSDTHSKINWPKWMENDKGKGAVIESKKGNLDLKLKMVNEGEFELFLRGIDSRDKNKKRRKILIDYTTLTINDKEYIEGHEFAWHDEPFILKKSVKNSEILNIHIEWTVKCNLESYVQLGASFNKKYEIDKDKKSSEVQSIMNKNKTLENNLTKLQTENTELTTKYNTTCNENKKLENNLTKLQTENTELTTKYNTVCAENKNLILKIDHMKNKNKSMALKIDYIENKKNKGVLNRFKSKK